MANPRRLLPFFFLSLLASSLLASPAGAGRDPLDTRLPRHGTAPWSEDPRVAAALEALPEEARDEVRGWLTANASSLHAGKGRGASLRRVLAQARAEDAALLRSLCADLEGIRMAELAYKAAFDELVPAGPAPRPLEALTPAGVPWRADRGFETLGWAPRAGDGTVRPVFSVEVYVDPDEARPTYRAEGVARLWSGRWISCRGDETHGAAFDPATAAFLATPEGQATWFAPPPEAGLSLEGEAGPSPAPSARDVLFDETGDGEVARAAARGMLDALEAAPGSPRELSRWVAEASNSLPGRAAWSRCGAGFTRTGLGWVSDPFPDCPLQCTGTPLPGREDGGLWDRPGDGAVARALLERCAPVSSLGWIPRGDRERMRPADLLALLTVAEPLAAASKGDRTMERRARRLARTLARHAVEVREAGLASMVDVTLRAIANVDRTQKLRLLLYGLSESAREWSREKAPGELERVAQEDGERTDEQRAAARMASAGGACVTVAQGPALAARLMAMDPAAAQAHLLEVCDAQGPDPVFQGNLVGPFHAGVRAGGGVWPDPLVRRQRLFWGTYWLARTVAEPVLAELARSGSAVSEDVAADVRASLVGWLPERPDVPARVRAAVEGVRGVPSARKLPVAAASLSALAVEAHLLLSRFGQRVLGDATLTEVDEVLLSWGDPLVSRCDEGGGAPEPGCPTRALIAAVSAPLLAAIEADPAGSVAATDLRGLLADLGVAVPPSR